MSRGADTDRRRWTGTALALCVLALTAGRPTPAQAVTEGRPSSVGAAPVQAPQRHHARGLDARVELLSKALALDARQRVEVKRLLERQREQVRAVWSDSSVPAAERIVATQAIGDRTSDDIRALLNDEQKKRYHPPRQARPPQGSSPSVEEWMGKRKAK